MILIILTTPLFLLNKIFNLSPEIGEYAYEELLLTILSNKVGQAENQKTLIKNICSFMEEEILADSYFYAPTNLVYILNMGNALCSSGSRVMIEMLQRNGIPSRLAISSNHVFVEAFFMKQFKNIRT